MIALTDLDPATVDAIVKLRRENRELRQAVRKLRALTRIGRSIPALREAHGGWLSRASGMLDSTAALVEDRDGETVECTWCNGERWVGVNRLRCFLCKGTGRIPKPEPVEEPDDG